MVTRSIVCFGDDSQLRKVGKNAFELTGAESIPLENVTIRQGHLEGSNANATDLMIEMLAARRSYETAQKIFQMQDQTLGRAVNDVGRLG